MYAFDDVRTVRLSPAEHMSAGDDSGERASGERASGEKTAHAETKTPITFDFAPGAPATLTMHLGSLGDPSASAVMDGSGGDEKASDTSNTAQERRMTRMMLQDAKMGIAVEPQGTLVETDAAHRSENGRVTLMELDFNELMADSKAFERFMKASDQDLTEAEMEEMMRTLPGVRVEMQETVTMRFNK